MEDICRLCLCKTDDFKTNLYENTEVLTKISSCLQIRITVNDLLPYTACSKCINKLEDIQNYLKQVKDNQVTLTNNLNFGENILHNFYSELKVNETKEKNTLHVDKKLEKQDGGVCSKIEIKIENTELEDCPSYSSDDNITLSSIKIKKEKEYEDNSDTAKTKEENTVFHQNGETKKNFESASVHKCLTCFKKFDSQQVLKKHYKMVHGSESELVNLDIYFKFEGEQSYKCLKCDKLFKSKKYVKRHLGYTHLEKRPYVCNLCGRTYKVVDEILKHARSHGGGFKHPCSFKCGYSTSYLHNLQNHERIHKGEYKYKCEKCGKGFQVKTWFEEHQNIHNGTKPFICDVCGASFYMKKYLTKHKSVYHHHDSSEINKYNCMHCSMPLQNQIALKRHLLKEHGIKSVFVCDVCGKIFENASRLKFHMTFHSGVRGFLCSVCKKSFKTKYHLKRHEAIHNDIDTFVCSDCGKSFGHRTSLIRHISRHHPTCTQKYVKEEKSLINNRIVKL